MHICLGFLSCMIFGLVLGACLGGDFDKSVNISRNIMLSANVLFYILLAGFVVSTIACVLKISLSIKYQAFTDKQDYNLLYYAIRGFISKNYEKSESFLKKYAKRKKIKWPYLCVTRCAIKREAPLWEINNYLHKAKQAEHLEWHILNIEVLLLKNHFIAAKEQTEKLMLQYKDDLGVLRIAKEVYIKSRDYKSLYTIVPRLLDKGICDEKTIYTIYKSILEQLKDHNIDTLKKWWQNQPCSFKKNTLLQATFLDYLIKEGLNKEAEMYLIDFLSENIDPKILDKIYKVKIDSKEKFIEIISNYIRSVQSEEFKETLINALMYLRSLDKKHTSQ